MGSPSSVNIGESLTFSVVCHDPDTGTINDADTNPLYRLYENETGTPLLTGNMAKLDDANTTGFYTATVDCTVANGFESSKTYTIYISATVNGNTGGISYGFRVPSDPLGNLVPGTYLSGTAGAALGRIGGGQIVTVGPVAQSGTPLRIVRGDDYSSTDGRALEWTDISASWPDLTSGSIAFTARNDTRDSSLSVVGSVVTPTGSNKKVMAEPTHAQTTPLKIGNDWRFDVQATLSNGHIVTLVLGTMSVLEDYTV